METRQQKPTDQNGGLIGRRRWLLGAGAGLSVGALMLAAPNAASAEPTREREAALTGSWLVTLSFNPLQPPIVPPPAPSTAVNSFAAGGAFAAIVLSTPGAPAPALGTWELTGDHSYKATVWQTETTSSSLTIALRVSLQGTFDRQHIQSTFTFGVFLPSNLTSPVATGSGTSAGDRIVA